MRAGMVALFAASGCARIIYSTIDILAVRKYMNSVVQSRSLGRW